MMNFTFLRFVLKWSAKVSQLFLVKEFFTLWKDKTC
jgi:hypothetical protein